MSKIVATFFYVGYLRPAPGTWGSLAGLLAAVPLIYFGGALLLGVGAALAFGLGVWATQQEAGPDDHDPSRIVIDEVAGQWVALIPCAWLYQNAGQSSDWTELALMGLVAFAFFRLFDIWKPWPVSWADQREDALGVMLDDILAGVLAALAWLGAMGSFVAVGGGLYGL